MIKKNVTFRDSIIAAAMLKYQRLSALQLIAIEEDLKSSGKIIETSSIKSPLFQKCHYFIIGSRDEGLRLLAPLDERLCDIGDFQEQCTVRDALTRTTTKELISYFETLDLDELTNALKNRIDSKRSAFKERINVLLIDTDPGIDYYKILKEYGFRKIDYFPSAVRAETYFKAHPAALSNYQLILNQSSVSSFTELNRMCQESASKRKVISAFLWEPGLSNNLPVYYFNGRISARGKTIPEFLDKVVEISLLNYINNFEKLLAQGSSPRYTETIAPKLPLPTKKKDLKILFLTDTPVDNRAYDIASKYGLDITFYQDNNFAFDRYALRNLSDYDIIISHKLFSFKLVFVGNESSEQAKDTGRNLTLLLTYERKNTTFAKTDLERYGKTTSDITFWHNYGGLSVKPLPSPETTSFKMLIPEYDEDSYIKGKFYFMEVVIRKALNTYNNALKGLGGEIADLDIPDIQEYIAEYESAEAAYREKERQKELERSQEYKPLFDFDYMRLCLKEYLILREKRVITKTIPDLNIFQTAEAIHVERTLNHQQLFNLIIPLNDRHENVRVFKVQVRSKKSGKMTPIEDVALFTKWAAADMKTGKLPKYNCPNDLQKDALVSLMLKIQCDIVPLVTEAKNKGLTTDTKKTFKPKK